MERSAGPRRGSEPSEPTLPVDDLVLPPPQEVTIVPTTEPPPLPPNQEIHRRRSLPRVREGPPVSDPTPTPPIGDDER